MATITGFTAARMLAIEQNTIVSGLIVDGHLILTTQGGQQIDAGQAKGVDAALGSVTVAPDTTIVRTNDGRAKAATPTQADDLTTKAYVDIRTTQMKIVRLTAVPVANGLVVNLGYAGLAVRSNNISIDPNNSSRIIFAQAGSYQINISMSWTANASGSRQVRLFNNGGVINEPTIKSVGASGSDPTDINYGGELDFAAGDALTIAAYQSSGASLNLISQVITIRRVV